MTRRFALHFAFATNMSKNASDVSPKVESRGLGPQCRAGSRLSYTLYIFTETRELQTSHKANLTVPVDLRLVFYPSVC